MFYATVIACIALIYTLVIQPIYLPCYITKVVYTMLYNTTPLLCYNDPLLFSNAI